MGCEVIDAECVTVAECSEYRFAVLIAQALNSLAAGQEHPCTVHNDAIPCFTSSDGCAK